jgi:hypothetical protein
MTFYHPIVHEGIASSKNNYYLVVSGEKIGPLKGLEVWAKIQTSTINEKTLAWTEGLKEWKALDDSSWEEHGIRIVAKAPKQPLDAGVHQTECQPLSSEIVRHRPQALEPEPESEIYLRKLELGWWSKVLNQIEKADILEDLDSLNLLQTLQQRIRVLSVKLIESGVMLGNAFDFIDSEYYDLDKSAELAEKKVQSLLEEVASDSFIEDLFNSNAKEEGIAKLLNIIKGIHNICQKFCEANSQKITADVMVVWNMVGDRFGENEDLPLIHDLIGIFNKDCTLHSLENVQSPIIYKIKEILYILSELLGDDGQIKLDSYTLIVRLDELVDSPKIKSLSKQWKDRLNEAKVRLSWAGNWSQGLPTDVKLESWLAKAVKEQNRLKSLLCKFDTVRAMEEAIESSLIESEKLILKIEKKIETRKKDREIGERLLKASNRTSRLFGFLYMIIALGFLSYVSENIQENFPAIIFIFVFLVLSIFLIKRKQVPRENPFSKFER